VSARPRPAARHAVDRSAAADPIGWINPAAGRDIVAALLRLSARVLVVERRLCVASADHVDSRLRGSIRRTKESRQPARRRRFSAGIGSRDNDADDGGTGERGHSDIYDRARGGGPE
jgi:hypothetical protein